MRLSLTTLAIASFLLASTAARAAPSDGPRENVRALAYDTRVDLAVTSVGALWLGTSEVMKSALVPEKCRWCYRAEDGSDVLNPYDGWVRKKLVWENAHAADITSSVIAFVIQPMAAMGLTAISAGNDRALKGFPVDALIMTEATIIAADVNQVAKFAFARERPFVHFLPRVPNQVRALTSSPSDDNLSFFSGHTSLAFAMATSSGTVNSMRGYRLAPLVWASGMTMAVSVGYLRIAADKHYFSDVMVGAISGSLFGVGVPLLVHSQNSSATPPPSASGQALSAPVVQTAFSMSGAW